MNLNRIFTTTAKRNAKKKYVAAKANWESDQDGFSALAYAAHIVLATGPNPAGLNSYGEIALSQMFDSASRASMCLDCFHDECIAVGDLMATAYRLIERAERIEKQRVSV